MIRGYQVDLRLLSEHLTDTRYGWGAACEESKPLAKRPMSTLSYDVLGESVNTWHTST